MEMLRRLPRGVGQTFLWLEDRPLLIILLAGVAAIDSVLLLAGQTHLHQVLHALSFSHSLLWLIVCFAGEVAAYLGYVLAARDMARVDGGPRLSFRLATKTVIAGFGVFAATRSSGGFAVDYWALRRSGVARRAALVRVLGLSALEYVILAPIALISALVLFFDGDGHAAAPLTLPWLLVLPGFAAAIWASSPGRAERLIHLDGSRLRAGLSHAVEALLTLRILLTSPRQHGLGVAGVSLYWAGDIICLWSAIVLVGGHITAAALVVGYATGYVLTRRSLPAGGAGIVEVALTFALSWVGLGFGHALAAVVLYRVFNFWIPIIPALLTLPTIRELKRGFEEAEAADAFADA